MLAQLKVAPVLPTEVEGDHILVLLPKNKTLLLELFQRDLLSAVLKRKMLEYEDLIGLPYLSATLPDGQLVVWVMLDFSQSMALLQTRVRKAMMALLQESPCKLAVIACGSYAQRQLGAEVAAYIAWVNGVPTKGSQEEPRLLSEIALYGAEEGGVEFWHSLAAGNVLCRALNLLPIGERTPLHYRAYVQELAELQGWHWSEYEKDELQQIASKAFCFLSRNTSSDTAIVHLSYHHPDAQQTVALIGQYLCKSPQLSVDMLTSLQVAQELGGAAVCLGVLLAATQQQLPLDIDCWLAISQDEFDVIVPDTQHSLFDLTLNCCGSSTLVLAELMTFALQDEPDLVIDFTSSAKGMAAALGQRASGVFSNDEELQLLAVEAGRQCGERLVAFPLDEDLLLPVETGFISSDVMSQFQISDHILSALFLKRCVRNTPWLHVDLAAAHCQGGLAAISSEITGFGVLWGGTMLAALSQQQQQAFDE